MCSAGMCISLKGKRLVLLRRSFVAAEMLERECRDASTSHEISLGLSMEYVRP